MAKAILGRKLGMTQIFTEEGRVVPVTVVESGNNFVLRSKTVESDGYNAVQIGFGDIKEKNVTKPLKGQFEKAGVKAVRFIREMRLAAPSEYNVGDTIGVDIFAEGDLVDVVGTGLDGCDDLRSGRTRPQGQEAPGPHGRRARHRAASDGRPCGRRPQPHSHQGRDSGPEEGIRCD